MEQRISVLVEPDPLKKRYRLELGQPMNTLTVLQRMLNPELDPNESQRVMSWRTEYNLFRREHAMPPALWKQALALVAQWKAEDMRNRNYFSHYTPEGWAPWDLCAMAGVTPPGYVAECIGGAYDEAHPLLEAYIESPDHLQVLEDDRFTHHGIGECRGSFRLWSMFWLGGI